MFSFCHPEATCCSSPKDLGAPRKSTALFAVERMARLAHILIEGGQKRAKFGQSRAIRAVYRAFGSDFHRLLVFSSNFPLPLSALPLRTTLYHILAVSRLLSRTNLMVDIPLSQRLRKVRRLVVNQTSDHKGLGLRSWFFRYSFATISLALRDWRGFSCGKLSEYPSRRTSPSFLSPISSKAKRIYFLSPRG